MKKGLRQVDLVRITGLSSGMISVMRKRLTMPSAENAWRIAKALNTTVEYLLTGESVSGDDELDAAFDDIRLGKRTREIALLLPELDNKQADLILEMLRQMGIPDQSSR